MPAYGAGTATQLPPSIRTSRRTRVSQTAQRLELIRTWTQGGVCISGALSFQPLTGEIIYTGGATFCCDFLHAERNTACELWSKYVPFRKPRTSPAWLPTDLGSNAWHEQQTVLGRRCAARGVDSSAGIQVRSEQSPVQASSVESQCSRYGSTLRSLLSTVARKSDADCNADLRATVTSCY